MWERLLIAVVNMSWTASAVILLVLPARLLLRRTPKAFPCELWLVVWFRLCCPVSPRSIFSLLPIRPNPIPAGIGLMQSPRIESGIGALDRSLSAFLPPARAQLSANPMQLWIALAAGVWLAGALLMLLRSLLPLLRLWFRLRAAVPEEGNVWRLPGLDTPFILGVFRPRIYLPEGLSPEEESYILLHEQTHIRRLDPLVRGLSFLILCAHWFNPLVHLAYRLHGRDIEMSCDERVIARLGGGVKRAYSSSLLSLTSGRRLGAPLAFGEGDTGPRIKNILGYHKPARWMLLLGGIAVAALCVGLALNPAGGARREWVLAQSPVTLRGGAAATLELALPAGVRVEGEEAGLGGGVLEGENYVGTGELRLLIDGRQRFSLPVAGEDGAPAQLAFNRIPFALETADYNGDGNPDFAVGQWGSSSINLFSLYTIDAAGKITPLSEPFGIASSEGKGERDFSLRFAGDGAGYIETRVYDNAAGVERPVRYDWDADAGLFREMPERRLVQELLAGCALAGGAAVVTIPPDLPQGARWALHVAGSAPMGEGRLSLHAFEEQDVWEPGRTYRAQLFEGDAPGGTVLDFDARLIGPAGEALAEGSIRLAIGEGRKEPV